MPTPDLHSPTAISGRPPDQIAFLVEDIERSIAEWSRLRPGERWSIYHYGPANLTAPSYRGAPGDFSMLLAFLGSDPQVELVQPLTGPSIYHDWIAEHGYGFHHVGYHVRSLLEATEQLTSAGHEVIQSGRGYGLDGDGGFAYFDFETTLGAHLEVIEVPRRRRPSLDPQAFGILTASGSTR